MDESTDADLAAVAARQVLAELALAGDGMARGADAEQALQSATESVLGRAEEHLLKAGDASDETLAAFLATLGDEGIRAAAEWRGAGAWQQTLASLAPSDPAWIERAAGSVAEAFARTIALVLWRSGVRGALDARRAERESQAGRTAGAIVAVAAGLARVATPQLELGLDEWGAAAVTRPDPRSRASGTRVAIADPPVLPVAAREVLDTARALQALGSQYALPVAETLMDLSQTLRPTRGVDISAGGARLRFASWTSLAQLAMATPPEKPLHPDVVRNVRLAAWAWARTPIRWPDGIESSALWVLDDEVPRPGAPAHGPAFTLSERAQLGATQRARQGRRLGAADWENVRIVPLVRPRIVPPAAGSNRNSYGPQAAFLRLLWCHFTRQGRHLLLPPHGIPVTAADVAALAEEAQLASSVARAMLPHYAGTGVVEHIGGDLFVPADAAARAFIAAGWRRSEEARRAGLRGAKRRARGVTLRITGTSDDPTRTSDGEGGNLG
jgi:hypothetical protein